MNGLITTVLRTQQRAIDAGFDWPSTDASLEKVQEELNELSSAIQAEDRLSIEDEYGDLLLSMTNLSLHLNVDVMQALQNALEKFNRRYAFVIEQLKQQSLNFQALTIQQKLALWQTAKQQVG